MLNPIAITGDFTSSIWLRFYQPDQFAEQQLGLINVNTRYSPSADWEKVFILGDQINKELGLSERDILDEIILFRDRKKTQEKGSR